LTPCCLPVVVGGSGVSQARGNDKEAGRAHAEAAREASRKYAGLRRENP
jgi:hypothetical protein